MKSICERRNEALTRLVLVLSGQQLVTGLAILITSHYERCSISGYNCLNRCYVGLFLFNSPLSTVAVLHFYFEQYPILKTFHLLGMVALLGLLCHAQLYSQYRVYWNLSIQYTFKISFLGMSFSPCWMVLIGYSHLPEFVGALLFLLFAYCNNILKLYSTRRNIRSSDGVKLSLNKN